MNLQEQISDINSQISNLQNADDKAVFVNMFIVPDERYSSEAITLVVENLCKEPPNE